MMILDIALSPQVLVVLLGNFHARRQSLSNVTTNSHGHAYLKDHQEFE